MGRTISKLLVEPVLNSDFLATVERPMLLTMTMTLMSQRSLMRPTLNLTKTRKQMIPVGLATNPLMVMQPTIKKMVMMMSLKGLRLMTNLLLSHLTRPALHT